MMATITTTQSARPKALHIMLWFSQAIVAGMFMMAGSMKTFTPIAELSVMIPWAKDSEVLIRFIGISELLGALG